MSRRLSPQALAVLNALAHDPGRARHGYDLGQEIGLKAGSLYPILIRLADQGLVAATWEDDPPVGRPRRHLYRILGAGQQAIRAAASEPERRSVPVRSSPVRSRGPAATA